MEVWIGGGRQNSPADFLQRPCLTHGVRQGLKSERTIKPHWPSHSFPLRRSWRIFCLPPPRFRTVGDANSIHQSLAWWPLLDRHRPKNVLSCVRSYVSDPESVFRGTCFRIGVILSVISAKQAFFRSHLVWKNVLRTGSSQRLIIRHEKCLSVGRHAKPLRKRSGVD